ncbi:thioesterase [Thalassobaculum fulvum]|uniref:Thioesterase n=1 Tax=Thalassobaculum fulvum TaxID=1633335 RepID=A0A918XSP0_9PROT|nr:alpha/beta fold hydrolase [Thalassobaculum fulvum]GHD52843.1 thioesterase [Thalassobaculum fulvum]
MTSDWLVSYRPTPSAASLAAATRIVALPHAGAGPTVFRQAAGLLPDDLELLAAELPGHGKRLSEPPHRRSETLIAALLPAVVAAVQGRDWVLFGHSMGAFLAHELCRALRRAGHALPRRLIVSGRRPPNYPAPELDLHKLPDADFVHELTRRYDGIPAVIRNEPELLQLFLPVLKADFEVFETYRFSDEPPLDLPIAIWGGRDDPQTAQMDGWADLAAGPASQRLFDGGHFYLTDRPERFARALAEETTNDRT